MFTTKERTTCSNPCILLQMPLSLLLQTMNIMKPIWLFLLAYFCCTTPISAQKNFRWAFTTYQYDRVSDFTRNLAIAAQGRLKGYIDTTGKVHIRPQYNVIDGYAENLAAAGYLEPDNSSSIVGFINRQGQFVVEPEFENTGFFQEGLVNVKKDGKWGYLNREGQMVIPLQYEYAYLFVKGLAAVKINGKYGFIDRRGNFVIPPIYDSASNFSQGLACVKKDGRSGYINEAGVYVIPPRFDAAYSFREGLAKVEIGGKFGFINLDGELVIPPQFELAFNFHYNLACVRQNGLWGYIDRQGNYVISPQYQDAHSFSEELACVKKDSKWGYVWTDGSVAIPPYFDEARDFNCELAYARAGNKKGFIRYVPPLEKELTLDRPQARPEQVTRRAIGEGRRITVAEPNFYIEVYDHKRIDGDIISLNYNGEWILKQYELGAERHRIPIVFDPELTDNYLLFYAKNLGREPPNTAAIVISDGHRTQEVILNADLSKCDIIYFDWGGE